MINSDNDNINNINPFFNPYLRKIASVASDLPVVTVSNMRSLFPKIRNYTLDFHGLSSFSSTRPNKRTGGGAAVIINTERFKAHGT